jgi:DNA repair protein RadC
MKSEKMQDLPMQERPYEKCRELGPSALTDTELLAVLLRSGTQKKSVIELCRTLLDDGSGNYRLVELHNWTYEKLICMDGIGNVRATQILCLAELSRRLSKAEASVRMRVDCPASIANYYMEDLCHLRQEVVMLLMLDSKSGIIKEKIISKGTVNYSVITPREIFAEALLSNAVAVILIHNHPSGDSSPSKDDIHFTSRVRESGELINVQLLDHIIIGNNNYTSFAEKGLLNG